MRICLTCKKPVNIKEYDECVRRDYNGIYCSSCIPSEPKNFSVDINSIINRMVKAATDLFAQDPHRFSSRPCRTCNSISVIVDEPWGCEKKRQDELKNRSVKKSSS